MRRLTMSPANETPCTEHEQQIQENSKKIAELETRADYKDVRITELIENNKRIEAKLDKLNETVNTVVVNSIKDDNDLKQRVVTLETKIETQNNVLEKYKAEQRKQRKEDREKTNTYLSYISVGLALLVFVLTYIFK